MLKFSAISRVFSGFIYFNKLYISKLICWRGSKCMIRSVFFISICNFSHNYLALLKTTQWWFRWRKMAPDWLGGGRVHLNILKVFVNSCILGFIPVSILSSPCPPSVTNLAATDSQVPPSLFVAWNYLLYYLFLLTLLPFTLLLFTLPSSVLLPSLSYKRILNSVKFFSPSYTPFI